MSGFWLRRLAETGRGWGLTEPSWGRRLVVLVMIPASGLVLAQSAAAAGGSWNAGPLQVAASPLLQPPDARSANRWSSPRAATDAWRS